MATKVDRENTRAIRFLVQFEKQQDQTTETFAHAFDESGKLLESAAVKNGVAELKLTARQLKTAALFIAPALPKGEDVTLRAMKKIRAYQPAFRLRPGAAEVQLLPIPQDLVKFWKICFCRIRGRVVRPVELGGSIVNMPVCNARVRICEVDRWWDILIRIPDRLLMRWRKDLGDLAEGIRPPRPEPPPVELLPARRDFTPATAAVMNGARLRLDRVALNPQPLPPAPPPRDLIRLEAPSSLRAALQSDSANVLRQALREQAALLRPYICWWPYLWPYFCVCDEITTVTTDSQGRFDTWMIYPCGGDHPDLYFRVDYCLGGVWTPVYHPPVCCYTHWNYECGTEITIPVTDPRVPWCGGDPPLPGKQVAVLSVGEGVSLDEIRREMFGVAPGLTNAGEPFAGSLEPRVWFGEGLIPAGVTHYRWSYRKMPAASTDEWTALDQEVVRHYAEELADGTLTFKPFPLGPDPALAGQALFKIRPADPPLAPGAVSSSWSPEVSARANTASAYFPTHALNGGDAVLSVGPYELKLELFHANGTPVDLTAEGIAVKTPTVQAPFGVGVVPTRAVPTDAAFPLAPMEDRVIRHPVTGNILAFRMVLHVDNRPCQAEIFEVWADSNTNTAGPCGFISYGNKATSNAHISFRAHHPGLHATFGFTVVKGSTGGVAAASASGPVGVGVNLFANNAATGVFEKDVPVAALLDANAHVCTKAAFGETLAVDSTATDGWSRAYWLDDDATPKAFALEPI